MDKRSLNFGQGFVHLVLVLICLAWILPTLGLLVSSFRPAHLVSNSGWWTVFLTPFDLTQYTLQNYQDVLTKTGICNAFLITVFVTVLATILPDFIGPLSACPFAQRRFPLRQGIFLPLIGLLDLPIPMTRIPILRLYSHLQPPG